MVSVVIAMLLPGASGAAAAPVEACNPTPEVATSFCVTSDVAVNASSSAPLRLVFDLANTSPGTTSSTWLSEVTVALAPGTAGPFGVTPSTRMPAGQVIAATPSCTSPAFSDCAGYGTTRIAISGFAAGTYTGTFGLRRITNVNPPAVGMAAEYAGIVDICVPFLGSPCYFELQEDFSVLVPDVPAASPRSLTVPMRFTGVVPGGGSYDAAVHTFHVAISGMSTSVYNGSTEEPTAQTRVLSTPQQCGTVTGTVTARTGESAPRVVEAPHAHSIIRCPVARATIAYDGFTATFDASQSTAATGRTVTRWFWDFGDGTTRATSVSTVKHAYTTFGNHTATLSVRDSAGARSAAISRTVRGTQTTAQITRSPTHVQVAGEVKPAHSGAVTVALERKVDGTFQVISTKKPALTAGDYATQFLRPSPGECRLRATFPGDEDHLGSRFIKAFAC